MSLDLGERICLKDIGFFRCRSQIGVKVLVVRRLPQKRDVKNKILGKVLIAHFSLGSVTFYSNLRL